MSAYILVDCEVTDPARYEAYVAGVRREYAHVPDAAFRMGRAAVLRSLVDRQHLFSTSHAQARWEAAARANVSRELASLAGPPGRGG